jgi:hypothetical protein
MKNPLRPTNPSEPLALARPAALLIGGAVVALSGLAWGPTGTLAAGVGTLISVVNVWVLERLGARAVRQAAHPDAGEAVAAASRLQLALGGKTIILLALVAYFANRGPVAKSTTAFTLGLLVSVFALVAGGLLAPLAQRAARST